MIYKTWYHRYWDEDEAPTLYQEWVFVKEVQAEDLEEVFVAMQGEVWSPNGEARPLIEKLELSHTSMSVGDFIETPKGDFYRIENCGFELYSSLPKNEKISESWR